MAQTEIECFAKCIIDSYGFKSNWKTGFSCYIPDPVNSKQGPLIWNYSRRYSRLETKVHMLFTRRRRRRMMDLGVDINTYLARMEEATCSYLADLDSLDVFVPMRRGKLIRLASGRSVRNLGASFSELVSNTHILRDIEHVFTNNMIIEYISSLQVNGRQYFKMRRPSKSCYGKCF